jgi:UDP-glucose 4-epimerase
MRILLSGGMGYVGRTLYRLLTPAHTVYILDNLRYGQRLTPNEAATAQLATVDIRDAAAVATLVRDFAPDVIIHLAAIHFIPECEQQPDLAVSTNVTGTVHLLAACPPTCRFVFASSGAVYAPEPTPHREESSPLAPSDVYGFTKWQGEQYVRYFATKTGFPAVIVRLFNVVGPGETNPHLLPEIVAQLKAGYTALRLGNLSSERDYIHVKDAAQGFMAAALQGAVQPGETVVANLGTQVAYAGDQLLAMLRERTGINFAVETDPSRLRKVDRPYLAADNTRMRERFGWRPQHTLQDTLTDIWQEPDLPPVLVQKYLA